MFTLAALLVGLGLLEEGEGLADSGSSHSTGAALNLRNAVGVLADKLALGLGAVGLVAFPVTSGLFAHGFAFGLGSLAVSDTVRLFADGDALRAVEHFATFIRALNFTFGLLALDVANGILGLSAGGVAFGGLADGVADGRAVRVVTFPGTLGMTLQFKYYKTYLGFHECAGNGG